MKTAFFAGGCYWCLEAIYRKLKGVEDVISGFAIPFNENGKPETKVETIKVTYDEEKLDFLTLVRVFFSVHDPTTLNRQGNDVGPEYRSVAFYNDEIEKRTIETVITELENEQIFENPIVTEVRTVASFKIAPESHQNYYEKNKGSKYCSVVISPKIAKFRKGFLDLYRD